MSVDLNELKTYIRIDGSEDDAILVLLVSAAEEYLAGAGVIVSDKALYKLAVMLHVAMNYENRNPAARMERFGYSLESIILQLKAEGV